MKRYIFAIIGAMIVFSNCNKDNSRKLVSNELQNDKLRLNNMQILASHNSYRIRTTDTVLSFLYQIQSMLPANLNPDGLDYTHENFDVQMSTYKMRGLEIDVYNDPNGGDFYIRKINSVMGLDEVSHIPDLLAPGMKVLHIKDVDYNTHYYTFKQSLTALKNWSENNPNHLPLFINIETKQDAPGDVTQLNNLGFQKAVPWDAAAADAIDAEIKSVFGEKLDAILTPDKARGVFPSLEAMARLNLWPTLGASRGKIIFIMQGAAESFYKTGHPSLKDRAMFVYAEPGTPEAAFVILNGAKSDKAEITQRVKQGYIVRTRADSDTEEARTGDYSSMDAAFESGAQIISTDYYKPDPRGYTSPDWSTFQVSMPGGSVARKNPVNATTIDVESAIND